MVATDTSAMRLDSTRVYGFVSLAILLLITAAVASAFTVYLLRYSQGSPDAFPAPVPYRVLVVRGSTVWAGGPGTRPTALPDAGVPGAWRGVRLAADGSGLVVIARVSGKDCLFLVRSSGRGAQALPAPPRTYGPGPWHVTDAAWLSSTDVGALWSSGTAPEADVVATYSVDQPSAHAEEWIRAQPAAGRAVALSPDGGQIARIESLPPVRGFAGEVQIRLRQLSGPRSSIALRYLGSTLPAAVLWSPDGGTLAIDVPGQGLSIQKSSGRPVHQMSSGTLPAAFSPKGASIAYVGGSKGSPRIHVLNLHGEVENVLALPAPGSPQALGWTPDARALVCLLGNTFYQLDPGTGAAQALPGAISGIFLGTVPATSPLMR